MPKIKEVKPNKMTVLCDCGTEFDVDLKDYESNFMEEFQQYENLNSGPCPKCGMIHIFNMNIPETELEIQEQQQLPYMPEDEKEKRKQIRELMWQKRKDLKGKDRAAFEKSKKDLLDKHVGKLKNETAQQAINKSAVDKKPQPFGIVSITDPRPF